MELLNYFSFPIQSNIYGLSCLQTCDGTARLLVATLERQIYCIENKHNKFSFREVHFTYVPSNVHIVNNHLFHRIDSFNTDGANIISIDSFQRSMNGHDIVVGITFVKPDKETTDTLEDKSDADKSLVERYYFNIYASLVTLQDFDLDHIARNDNLSLFGHPLTI